jgi:hypothetical protein
MSGRVATAVVVFGRGLEAGPAGIRLSEASAARVRAAVGYVEANRAVFRTHRARLVFTGGWAAAAEGLAPPPRELREAALMLEYGRALGVGGEDLARYADVAAETGSDSTLENVLQVSEGGYLGGHEFTSEQPLGIVAHEGHLDRIDYLTRKVLGLPASAVVRIPATGPDQLSRGLSERAILPLTRLALAGAGSHAALRRRHRLLVTAAGLIRPPGGVERVSQGRR